MLIVLKSLLTRSYNETFNASAILIALSIVVSISLFSILETVERSIPTYQPNLAEKFHFSFLKI